MCIDRIDGVHVTSLELRLGGSLPLHVGAAPVALLAYAPKEVRQRWETWATSFDLQPTRKNESVPDVLARLETIRRSGHSISNEDVTAGISSVGAPIFDHTGSAVAAISMSGLTDQILGDGTHAIEQVTRTATLASMALGWYPSHVEHSGFGGSDRQVGQTRFVADDTSGQSSDGQHTGERPVLRVHRCADCPDTGRRVFIRQGVPALAHLDTVGREVCGSGEGPLREPAQSPGGAGMGRSENARTTLPAAPA